MSSETIKPTGRMRTEELRREIERRMPGWRRLLRSRTLGLSAAAWAGFFVVMTAVVLWTRHHPLLDTDRVAPETTAVRAPFTVLDEPATEQARSAARSRAPRVYTTNEGVIESLRSSLESLPEALRNVESIEAVEPTLAKQFGLTEQSLQAVRQMAGDSEARGRWVSRVGRLVGALEKTPILDNATYQVEKTSPNVELELRRPDGRVETVTKSAALNTDSPKLIDDLRGLASEAGIQGALLEVAAARLAWQPRATFKFDSAQSAARADQAARAVAPTTIQYRDQDVILRRGEPVKASQLSVYREAMEQERGAAGVGAAWAERGVVAGLVASVTLALAGYTFLFVPRVRRNPARTAAIAGLIAGAALLACYVSVAQPGLIALTAAAPTVFVAVILCVSYDQRVALAYASLHGVLVATALDLPIGEFAVMLSGVAVAVWRLKEVRDRDALIKMGIWVAAALAAGTFGATLIHLPVTRVVLLQGLRDAALAGAGGLLVSGVTLFILPTLEKLFDITTGMTLVELRDPKQPLLRQLQQRAPGTYNHSLNVASLAESAAEAVGGNGLLAYVGALYHDIGKMNKPDYFVENQHPGFNRHDRLSPAMSVLVIVGHVKDGMELAREFGLPRPLHHFIESHHGTTLVEYFYHRARTRAERAGSGNTGAAPSEMEYRYPGPKPRSKETAIVMLCDAVESAARAMADPTPARIEATVRSIANKRLMDGQFDECDLTLRELNAIVGAVSRTLASIYHGRISYPALSAPGAAQPGGVGLHLAGQSGRPPTVAGLRIGERTNGIAALATPVNGAPPLHTMDDPEGQTRPTRDLPRAGQA